MQDIADNDLIRNLIDAGCDGEFIERFTAEASAGRKKELLDMLARHRSILLEKIHADERRIYRLDYLAEKLKNK